MKFFLFITVTFLCLSGHAAEAPELETDKLPRWEVGIAAAGQVLRDYRGSESTQTQALAIPFFIYRGSILKADRNGARAEFLRSHRIEFNLSGAASLNGGSDDNRLRRGMDELESAFELGPSININLTGDNFSTGWQLRLPFRGVATVGDSGIRGRGYTFNPRFTYNESQLFGRWRGKFDIGVLYGSDNYHDYYYSVDEAEVRDWRPFYNADAGFSGYYFKTSIAKKYRNHYLGVSLRYDNLTGATFEDSPLVETEHYFSLSFFIARVVWFSKE